MVVVSASCRGPIRGPAATLPRPRVILGMTPRRPCRDHVGGPFRPRCDPLRPSFAFAARSRTRPCCGFVTTSPQLCDDSATTTRDLNATNSRPSYDPGVIWPMLRGGAYAILARLRGDPEKDLGVVCGATRCQSCCDPGATLLRLGRDVAEFARRRFVTLFLRLSARPTLRPCRHCHPPAPPASTTEQRHPPAPT